MAKARKLNPSKLSTEYLTRKGWMVADVETRVTRTIVRDLWGFADLCCVSRTGLVLWLQVTSYSNMASRVQKCLESDDAASLLARGHSVGVWGWYPEADRFRRVAIVNNERGQVVSAQPHVVYVGAEDLY